ncbi:MAG: phenylacetate--CoA ligase [Chloroflexi bacterium]|nr:phenylacetate--CoA ligase [Chloroflexota bacterium]
MPHRDIPALIRHLAEHAPGFARRLQQAGLSPADIRSEADLARIPVLRKDDLAELQAQDPPFGGLLAVPVAALKRVFQSPGPIYEPEADRPDYWRWASALRAAGFGPGDVVLNAFAYHLTPAGAMFEEGLRAVGCVVLPGGVGNLEQQVQAMHALGVNGYVGLPSYLNALLDKAAALGLTLQVEKAFVTAEPLPPSLRQTLHEKGVRVVRQGYGTAECGNLGYECEAEDGWHVPEDVLVQICDINTGQPLPPGETGEVVVTLFHTEYALVRFGTGDLSALNPEPCVCGRTTPRLMGWRGRVGAAVKVRGMFLHPRQLEDLMRRFPQARAWQAVVSRQEHRDYLILRVAPAADADREALAAALQQAAREAIKFRLDGVEFVDALPPDAAAIEDTRTWE